MTLRLGIAIALALLAGVATWVGKRRLVRHIDDPLYTDRFYDNRVALVRVYVVIFVLITALAPRWSVWLCGVAMFSIMTGGFPSRRLIFGETWTFIEYLAQRIRLSVFGGAPWIALLAAPAAVEAAGVRWAPAVFVVVMLLYVSQQRLLLYGLASEPLRNPELIERFNTVLAKAETPPPAIFEGGRAEGHFLNAFALPAGKRSRVLLTRALLRVLQPDEVTAIFAHETAHLEQYAKRSMRRRVIAGSVLMPLMVVAPQAWFVAVGSPAAFWISVLWPVIFFFAIAAALTNRQKHETEADLRALQLGADPIALIGGLEKIHRFNGMPRRVDSAREARMSHPSLARRIQAIRRAAGLETALDASFPRTIAGRNPATSIVFTRDALEVGGVTYRYDAMQSLIARKTLRGWELFARTGKQRVRVPIATEAAAEVQTILDSVDSQLAHLPGVAPRRVNARAIAAVLVLTSLFPGISFAAVFAAIVALVSASAPALAALGAIAITAGLMVFTQPTMPFLASIVPALAAVEILFGIICLTLLRLIPSADRGRHLRGVVIALGALTALVLLPSILSIRADHVLGQTFLIARGRPSVAILLVGIGAALAVAGRRRVALVHAAVAILMFGAGTQMFGAVVGGDPLLSMHEPAWVQPSPPLSTRKLEGFPTQLRVSPDGQAFAVAASEADEDALKTTFTVNTKGSPQWTIEANDLHFLSSERVVKLDTSVEPMQVASVGPDGSSDGWRQNVPRLLSPDLTVEPDGTWRVSGRALPNYAIAQISGRVGVSGYSTSGHDFVYASMPALERRSRSMWAMMLSQLGGGTEFWREQEAKRERVGSTVLSGGQAIRIPGSTAWALIGNDHRTTYAGLIAGPAQQIRSAGAIGERAYRVRAGSGSRIAMHSPQSAYVWNLATGKAMRIRCDDCMVLEVALSDHALGVLVSRGSDTLLEMYPTGALAH